MLNGPGLDKWKNRALQCSKAAQGLEVRQHSGDNISLGGPRLQPRAISLCERPMTTGTERAHYHNLRLGQLEYEQRHVYRYSRSRCLGLVLWKRLQLGIERWQRLVVINPNFRASILGCSPPCPRFPQMRPSPFRHHVVLITAYHRPFPATRDFCKYQESIRRPWTCMFFHPSYEPRFGTHQRVLTEIVSDRAGSRCSNCSDHTDFG